MLYNTMADTDVQVVWGVFCGVTGNVPDLLKPMRTIVLY
jgi:hypothetical protein